MGRFPGLCSFPGRPEPGRPFAAAVGAARSARSRHQSAFYGDDSVSEHHSVRQQPPFPGSQEMERRIKSLVRWNALAMVVRANKIQEGIGGHISTFASAATLYEVAFNHFFRAQTENGDRDIVYFQGHAAPGIYSRAYLEGRISKEKLQNSAAN